MPATRATIVQQRQEVARLADGGLTYPAIAKRIGVSVWTVRKWVRRARRGGLSALVTHQGRGRCLTAIRWYAMWHCGSNGNTSLGVQPTW